MNEFENEAIFLTVQKIRRGSESFGGGCAGTVRNSMHLLAGQMLLA